MTLEPRWIPGAEAQFELLSRGVADLTEHAEVRARLEESHRSQRPLVVKAGFDPTAPDLHLGHMARLRFSSERGVRAGGQFRATGRRARPMHSSP